MTIKRFLIVNILIIILLLFILSLFLSILYIQRDIAVKKQIVTSKLVKNLVDLQMITEEYLTYRYIRSEQQWLVKYNNIQKQLEGTSILFGDSFYSKLDKLYNLFSKTQSLYSQDIARANNRTLNIENSPNIILEKRIDTQIHLTIREILTKVFKISDAANKTRNTIAYQNNMMIILFLFLMILILLIYAYKTIRTIIPSLDELVQGAQIIELGDLNYVFGSTDNKTYINQNNEIGLLASSFNSMTMRLVSLIENLETVVEENVKVEIKLRIERDNFMHILDSMTDGVSIVNEDYETEYVNPVIREKLGPFEGIECYSYFHNFKEPCVWCKKDKLHSGESIQWEWTDVKTGETFDLIDTGLQNSNGSISILEISRDITARRKTETDLFNHKEDLKVQIIKRTSIIEESNLKLKKSQQATLFLLEDMKEARSELLNLNTNLERSNKDLEAFSHSISHDLRSPLRAVLGFSSKLQKHIGNSSDTESNRLIAVISENTIKMQNLITDLLAYSKVGISNLSKNEIDMNQLVAVLYTDYENLVKEKEIELEILSLPNAYGNFSMIKQVVINLLDNAIKFSDKGQKASITIGYSKEHQSAYYIKDNGCGFDNKFSDEVFQIFKRVSTDINIEGTGVGLAIVKRIIESHNGHVWVDTELGKGSVFYFSLDNHL
jgi:signal transduction histidine kinase/HAMP domain-containing protein